MANKISDETIEYVGILAKLELSGQEKEDFIQDRQSVSYWKDAWRRLKKNVVAMVALGVIIFLFLFAFVGPLLIPYGYDEFNNVDSRF